MVHILKIQLPRVCRMGIINKNNKQKSISCDFYKIINVFYRKENYNNGIRKVVRGI